MKGVDINNFEEEKIMITERFSLVASPLAMVFN